MYFWLVMYLLKLILDLFKPKKKKKKKKKKKLQTADLTLKNMQQLNFPTKELQLKNSGILDENLCVRSKTKFDKQSITYT